MLQPEEIQNLDNCPKYVHECSKIIVLFGKYVLGELRWIHWYYDGIGNTVSCLEFTRRALHAHSVSTAKDGPVLNIFMRR